MVVQGIPDGSEGLAHPVGAMTEEKGQQRGPGLAPEHQAEVDALWREHRRWVAAILLAHMPREADLEDLLQDVAVTVVSRIGELRDRTRLRGWRLVAHGGGEHRSHGGSQEPPASRRDAPADCRRRCAA